MAILVNIFYFGFQEKVAFDDDDNDVHIDIRLVSKLCSRYGFIRKLILQ